MDDVSAGDELVMQFVMTFAVCKQFNFDCKLFIIIDKVLTEKISLFKIKVF